jgi:hypothetical protein
MMAVTKCDILFTSDFFIYSLFGWNFNLFTMEYDVIYMGRHERRREEWKHEVRKREEWKTGEKIVSISTNDKITMN